MAGILGSASFPFVGCVSLLVAMILHILGFASPHWSSDDFADYGLWKCDGPTSQCRVYWEDDLFKEDWMWGVRACTMLTILMWSIPLVVMPVYIYVALGLWYLRTLFTMTVFVVIGTLADAAAIIVYGIKSDNRNLDVEWSFIVTIIACWFGIISSIIFLVACSKRPRFEPQAHFMSDVYVDPYKNRLYVVETLGPPPKQPSTIGVGHVNPTLVEDD